MSIQFFECVLICHAPSVLQIPNVGKLNDDERELRRISRVWSKACAIERFNPWRYGRVPSHIEQKQVNNIVSAVRREEFDLVIVAGSAAPLALQTLLLRLRGTIVPVWNYANPECYLYDYVESISQFGILPWR